MEDDGGGGGGGEGKWGGGGVGETWKERLASWSTKEWELGEIGENYATMQLKKD